MFTYRRSVGPGSVGLLAVLLFSLHCTSQPAPPPLRPAAAQQWRVELLFLGDQGAHDAPGKAGLLMQALGPRGFNVTYTEDLGALAPATLAAYDGLLLYTEGPELNTSQANALRDFVAQGKGLIALHHAAACTPEGTPYADLIGACMTEAEPDTVTVETIAPDHPAVQGLAPFAAPESPARHDNPRRGRTVLQTQGEERTPWTWVRDEGRGRVFYTA